MKISNSVKKGLKKCVLVIHNNKTERVLVFIKKVQDLILKHFALIFVIVLKGLGVSIWFFLMKIAMMMMQNLILLYV